ncbi:pyridoxal-dependent decarboxylase [Hygrophoropsis aurantiaca]|uniref:Pyridoxal-dependent decarboxylase n=1 Tax=Hygrophoropsis aurantiaca TaxID=72124 RepID=A0ACB8A2M3_9AGAM|nr:pyridoxal-dependent decarboxylase [Hygrophoropsis aurantiaca]
MSQVEVLPATSPIAVSSTFSDSFAFHDYQGSFSLKLSTSPPNILTKPELSLSPSRAAENHALFNDEKGERIFSSLPPLFRGHPEIHLRNGIMNASRQAAANQSDAEKAFFVADLSQVYCQHERWVKALPEIEPHYAIKCNPDPYVLRLLAALGTGFDCASNGEISHVLNIGGIDPSRIIFANPCKAASFVRSAAKAGVDKMTFDNADELYKIARAHPGAKLIVRILADDSKSICRFGIKFGAPVDVVPSLLAKAKELNLDVIGVSFHVGSGCYDPSIYEDAIRRARAAFDMGTQAGYTFNLLDVGGGFEDAHFETAAEVLTDAINLYFPHRNREGIRIIAEPGRFYVSKAFSLAANIIARRAPMADRSMEQGNTIPEPKTDEPSVMYYINEGVYGAFNCIMFDHQVVSPYVLTLNGSFHHSASEPLLFSSVWGPTCDSIDCVCKMVELPSALQVGDWLGFDNMGAYTICAASQFNGFEFSDIVYTTNKAADEDVRRALRRFARDVEG